MIIRDLDADLDALAAARVLAAAHPFLVQNAAALAFQVRHAPAAQRYRVFVAEVDGEVVGLARCGLDWETSVAGQGFANVSVDPARRGRGAGTALLTAGEEYLRGLSVRTARAWGSDDAASERFAAAHGYRRTRPAAYQRRDLTAPLPPVPEVPAGVVVRRWAEFDDPRPLWEADADASRDEPADTPPDAIPYEGWLDSTWRRPDLDRSLSVAAVVDGVVAAFSMVQADRPRYWSGMTGTRRDWRGRGLAGLVKATSLEAAVRAGYAEAFTGNDEENAPMLAINRRLGYLPFARQWRCVKDLSTVE